MKMLIDEAKEERGHLGKLLSSEHLYHSDVIPLPRFSRLKGSPT